MTLLIDDLLKPGAYLRIFDWFLATRKEPEINWEEDKEWILRELEITPVYRVDNVADYYRALNRPGWHMQHDFPCVAPIHETFWMEWNAPMFAETSDHPGDVRDRVGSLFVTQDDDRMGARWLVRSLGFGRPISGGLYGPLWDIGILISEDGQIVLMYPIFSRSADEDAILTYRKKTEAAAPHLHPALLALCFLHCKNVVVTEEAGTYANRQERRAAERRDDPPLVKYRTLHIEPMKTIIKRESGGESVTMTKALHIVRGHIAEYGPDYGKGKLFGKYEGRFFIPAHVRGLAEQGIVDKRYVVHPPKDDAA